jgi:glycosyltransferase involved in cell wall biosynthesis
VDERHVADLRAALEGEPLAVAEALACGAPVVASDLPVLREVGGAAALYCPVGDVRSWSETVAQLLVERETDSTRLSRRRAAGIVQASTFSWAECAGKMCAVYRQLL